MVISFESFRLNVCRILKILKVLTDFKNTLQPSIYQFEAPAADFEICPIIIIASPTPAYARVIFHWQGKEISALSLARSYIGKMDAPTATKQYLAEFLKPAGYHIQYTQQLPLKRLAVRSGLAVYGRNNICYVGGMGSFLTLVAYFSDIPCTEDNWHEIRQMDHCQNCTACLKNCPTRAILKDRFLINNERCLSYFNEVPGDFPEWLPKSAHHCLYDCLMCQTICPQNKDYIAYVIGPIEFDETETGLLLSGKPMEEIPPTLQQKVKFLGMDQWLSAIHRNLKALVLSVTLKSLQDIQSSLV